MAERGENFHAALSSIAHQARTLLDNFNDRTIAPIEQRLLHQNDRLGAGETSSVTSRNSENMQRTTVSAALRRSFPTLGNKSSGTSKKPLVKKAKKCNIVYKDVVLLPSPSSKTVPTHQTRCQLENEGFVVHEFLVDKSLDEEDFKEKIKGLFSVLQDKEVDFDFVKSCYGQIVTPKIATGVKFSAARVLSISGQGSIYIRPKQDFPVSNESDESSAQGPLTPLPFDSFGVDGGSARSSVCNSNGASAPGPSRTVSEEDKLQQLVELFPNKSTDVLCQALNDHMTVSEAALYLSRVPTYAVSNDDENDVLSVTLHIF